MERLNLDGEEQGVTQRHLYRMKCPQCRHEYQYEGTKYEYEHCPQCPYLSDFNEFIVEGEKE